MESVTSFLETLASKGVKLSAEAGRLNCYARKEALTNEIREGLTKYKSEIIALLESGQNRRQAQIANGSATGPKEFPLSAGEKGLYILQKLHPELTAYNVPLCLRINSKLNAEILAKAWERTLRQFPILTARVIEKDGDLYHRLDDGCKTTIQRRSIDFADDRQLLPFLRERVKEPIDLNRGPLARIELFTRGERKSILLIIVHHIVFDGVSAMILLKSFFTFYRQLLQGEPVRLSRDLLGYQEFVAWEEAMLASAEGDAHAAYWRRLLAGELPITELPLDLSRSASPDFEERSLVKDLPEDLSRWVRDFSKTRSYLPSVIFLGVFQLLLHKYTNQDDIIVGMPVMGRPAQKFADEIGYFINMVPLRARFEEPIKLSEFLHRTRRVMLDALHHSSYPFPLMVEKLKTRQAGKNPVYQVTYAYQNFTNQAEFSMLLQQSPNLEIEYVTEIAQEEDSDLALEIFEKEVLFSVRLKYSPELYSRDAINRFFEHYCALLKGISENQDLLPHEYSVVTESEKHRLLVDYNDTRAEYPKDKCIHHLFEEQAAVSPERTAVVFGKQSLSYQDLYNKSHDLALYLQSLGVGPDCIVGLCLERSIEMMVAIMGTALAGGAYLPLDPDYPDERLAYMLEDSGSSVLLTQRKWEGRIGALSGGETRLVALDAGWPEVSERAAALSREKVELRREVGPHNLCYVIYTSGSTGKPKGVLVEHMALVNRIHWMQKGYALDGSDVVLQKTPYSFDVSVWEFFWPMMAGASVVFAVPGGHKDERYLEELINEAKVTTLHFVPSMLYSFLENARAGCGGVRRVFCSGEALDKKGVDRYKKRFPNAVLHNLYGPTEAAIDVTALDCSGLNRPFVPIGAPIDNIQIHILDRRNRLQPMGVPGELHIAGDGLARGYLNRPELTEEKFVANPFEHGGRMYKTGDLARWLEDGNIQYLGRIDTQVKIRGFRIELGEIETRLNEHPGIEDSAVVGQGEGSDKRLIAFYRAKDTTADQVVELPNEELRAHLLRTLPDYMSPAAFVSLVAIPLSPNGKVDRRTLERMDVAIESSQEYLAPRNETEKRLVGIWAEVLNLAPEKIGVADNFFELGGHSLLATQLVSKIRSRLDVDLPLKTLFEGGSVAQLAQLVAKAEKSYIPPIRPVDRGQFDRLPLSFAQERLWFINQLEPDSPGYNVPGAAAIKGELDIDQLEQAFNLIIERHENLRTLFPSQGGMAHQQILDHVHFKLERIDLSHYTDKNARDNEAMRLCQTEAATPFGLAGGPLIRGKVIKLAVDEHILMLNMHHIISDGWSLGVLIKELGVIMEAFGQGRGPELSPLPIQYVDYSVWQRNWLEEGGILARQLAYWQEKLAGVPESLDLATDYPRPNVQSFAGTTQAFALDERLTARLKGLAEEQGCTLYMVLLTAFKVLLHRYTGQSDICVGSPIANRQYGETEGLIGMFVNTLVLRSQIEEDDTFTTLLSKVKTTCLEAYEHQDAPFEKLVDMLRLQRNLAISPLFQIMVILQNVDMGTLDRRIQRYPLESGISKFDLTVEFTENSAGLAGPPELTGRLEYSTALYKPQTIGRMIERFIALCREITVKPAARIRDLDYLGEAEKRRLLVDFNATQAEYPKSKCIHHLFEEQVAVNPESTAVVFGEQLLSYQDLYNKSHDLALYLQSQGIGPDSIVGLCMERSLEMMVGIMGTTLAGGAYLPLDPDYPDERLTYMLQDSDTPVVLTQRKWAERVSALSRSETKLVALDAQWPEVGACAAALKRENVELRRDVGPHNLCYVIYTSGSTGKPKGALVEHRALVNRIHWMQKRYALDCRDVVLQKTPYSFDVSVWEFFWPMTAGASVVFAAPGGHKDVGYLEDLINDAKITTLHYVPSMLNSFLENARADCGGVRQVFCSGEALDKKGADRYKSRFPNAALHNLYGPTEAAIDVTAYDCSQLNYPFVPIGAPIDNIQIYILDQYGHLQPIGAPGELHIAGDGLARGYLNRPELTREKFVANPFVPGARMYKTGDLARWLEDGNIQYLGRIDAQVKIRGFRIELGEIEARLNEHPGIEDSAVVGQGEGSDKRLIAFYRAKDTAADQVVQLPNEELRAHLLRTLPDYMSPAAFVSLAAIPLNSNGKVDRRALERMDVAVESGREYLAPRNETEKQLVDIWAEVLGLEAERVGVNDNFFELGGHSLLAVTIIERMRREGMHADVRALFTAPTLRALAETIKGGGNNEAPPPPNLIHVGCQRITPEMLPLIALTQPEIDSIVSGTPGGAPNVQDIYPLAPLQEGMLFQHLINAEGDAYLMWALLAFDTRERLERFVGVMQAVIDRHDILRTAVVWERLQEPAQVVWREAPLIVEEAPLNPEDGDIARQLLTRFDPRRYRMNLTQAPLIRMMIAKAPASQSWTGLLLHHHLVGDNTSLKLILAEAHAHLEGRREQLAEPSPFRNFVAQARLGISREEHEAFFREMLADVEEPTAPFGLLDVQGDGSGLEGAGIELEAGLYNRLRKQARKLGVSVASLCHLAWAMALARVSAPGAIGGDVVFGTVLSGRIQGGAGAGQTLGLFINALPIRIRINEEGAGSSAKRTHRLLAELIRHEHSSQALAQRCSGVEAPSPLFSSVLNYRHNPRETEARVGSGLSWEGIELLASEERNNYPLVMSVDDLGDGLMLTAQAAAPADPLRVCEMMRTVLEKLAEALEKAPETPVRAIDALSEAERRQVVEAWNRTAVEYPRERAIHYLFEEQVERTPEAVAVAFEDQELTYQELNARANRLARSLVEQGAGPEVLVALLADRGIDFLIAMLAIFKTGGAYLPLDPSHPVQRISQALNQSRAAFVIAASAYGSLAAEAIASSGTENHSVAFILDELLKELRQEENLSIPSLPNQLAYVIYTSGSTGLPKGAMIEHRGMINHLFAKIETLRLTEKDIVAQTASQCFDISVWQFLAALLVGGQVRIFGDEIAHHPASLLDQLEIQRITILETVPSIMRMMLTEAAHRRARPDLSAARWLIPTGEALPPDLCRHWFDLYPEIPLLNAYGPTECSDDVTHCPIEKGLSDSAMRTPIGRPIANTQIYVLNPELQPQPIGVVGELCVGGEGVGRGYLNEAGKTSEVFMAAPFAMEAGQRLYKTGDLARFLPDGNLEYLGRIDHQVKIRGFRIELGEIEAALVEHDAVEQAVVLMREDQPGAKRLVAYVVKADISEVSHKEEWREFLTDRLPAYMVPAFFVELEKLPLTTNGKLDRRALPAPDRANLELGQGYVAPRTLIEQTLAEIWLHVLGVDQVGVYDDFFELGGHSLLATRLISRIRSQMNVDLPLKALFERGSVAQLAQLIEKAEKSDIPPIQPVDRTQFDRLPLSFAQERLWFINQLEPDSAGYNLPVAVTIRGELDINQLEQAFNLIIARHENLRTLFPSQDGQAQQLILDSVDFKLERIDLSHYETGKARDSKAKKICQTDAATPFDLAGGPLIRGKVIKLAVDEHILMLNMHHIISDGWSLGVLIKEIGVIMEAFREGRRHELAPLPIQYIDYSVWQRQWLEEGGTLARLLAYWREKLSDPPESLNLPTDYPRPSVQSLTGATQAFSLEESLTARLKGLAEEQGCTLYMVLLAAFKALLHRYTGQTDICVGTSIANRQYGETEGLIGFFVNLLALRTDLSGDPSFRELLGRVREVALGAYAHQDLPFGKLIEELHVQRSLNINPLFQVVFVLQNTPVEEVRAQGLSITPLPVETGAAQFDLVLAMEERGEGLEGSLTYSADLFERATAERMIRHLRNLLEEVVKDPERRLPSLQLMAEEEVRAYSSEQFKSLNLSRKGLEDLILEIEEARSE